MMRFTFSTRPLRQVAEPSVEIADANIKKYFGFKSIYLVIKRAKIVYIYIFVSFVYFENGSTDFDETNSINKF